MAARSRQAAGLLVVALLVGCAASDDGATVRDRDGSGELRYDEPDATVSDSP